MKKIIGKDSGTKKIKSITTNIPEGLVGVTNAEMVKLTGRGYRCELNISNSVRREHSNREDVKDSKCGVVNSRENKTHRHTDKCPFSTRTR